MAPRSEKSQPLVNTISPKLLNNGHIHENCKWKADTQSSHERYPMRYSRLKGHPFMTVLRWLPLAFMINRSCLIEHLLVGALGPNCIKAQFCKMPELKLNLLQRFRWETDVLLLLLWTTVPPTAILDRTCPVKFLLIQWSKRCTARCPNQNYRT